ncbi:hypothetical protein CTI12_AA203330 [Artemisia annua]|uniref:Uncharacterized protein n=1 Tax=Artemisia annua TaxID=35608 RepID=A0A2U1NBC0_ARTAN|nr:hypothetical protein CTI12_AA203330 [Artemisia annua]
MFLDDQIALLDLGTMWLERKTAAVIKMVLLMVPVAVITLFNFPLEIHLLQLTGALYMGNKHVLKVDSKDVVPNLCRHYSKATQGCANKGRIAISGDISGLFDKTERFYAEWLSSLNDSLTLNEFDSESKYIV